jgi:hypothetical protein
MMEPFQIAHGPTVLLFIAHGFGLVGAFFLAVNGLADDSKVQMACGFVAFVWLAAVTFTLTLGVLLP